jgi:hypothetical protein
MEVRMRFPLLRYGLAITYILTIALCLTAGCSDNQKPLTAGKGKDTFDCGDKTVLVVPGDGTAPKDVYLCLGDTLTWNPNHHIFTVSFPNKYPFEGKTMTFANDPLNPDALVVSPRAKNPGSLVVYHYDMTVDRLQIIDPQVVGGGYHSN